MDFYTIKEEEKEHRGKPNTISLYPDFKVCRSKDLMVRGRDFYAVWDEKANLWSTDEYDVQRLVDEELKKRAEEIRPHRDSDIRLRTMSDYSSRSWKEFKSYLGNISDTYVVLDQKLTFQNSVVTKEDHVSKTLPYSLEEGDHGAWDELISALYDPSEREKIEWAIGSIIAGDSPKIQKFLVFYGSAGTGKSTVLNIVQSLFEGYHTSFEAKALTGASNAFSTEVFRNNPLVAFQHDGDLSKIEDNTKLNSIVSHEDMTMNEKYKASYMARINAMLFMGTNKPVKITDAKSGIIRRLIDVRPTGKKIPPLRYEYLMNEIHFNLGALAYHCMTVYEKLGKNYYANYRPIEMILETDVFYNFVEDAYHVFKMDDAVSLTRAYDMYKAYCEDALVEWRLPKYKFRQELQNYFREFEERGEINGERSRSIYRGFIKERFKSTTIDKEAEEVPYSLVLDQTDSLLDEMLAEAPAQYASREETPMRKWASVHTTLASLDTHRLHYVKPPENHIVIDFDLRGPDGEKSPDVNLEAASKWPATYAEYSKSGAGVHLHYLYAGDTSELSRIYDTGIEIKVFNGDSSLRRMLSACNAIPVATLSSGLPLKEKKVINFETVRTERALRDLINRNLRKEIHPGTKPSIDFIHKILDDAYHSDLKYDLKDMRPSILAFANSSTNQALYCIKLVAKMKFESEEPGEPMNDEEAPLVFYDIECYPNLFHISWKYAGENKPITRLRNPTPDQIESLLKFRLVGFFCRKYDNHMLYAAYLGYTVPQLYELSQRLIANSPNSTFSEAYNLSYTDVYDFASEKKSLKRWEIELGIHHMEMDIPWDEPVPEERMDDVGDYCDNDVLATEVVFNERRQDFVAREILSRISGLPVNDTNNSHSARIIFGKERRPQAEFNYTDLSEMFPGYTYSYGKSIYRGEEVGEGGLVRSEPGMYTDVALLDIASMHPASIKALDLFGKYTDKFWNLVQARLAIKHKDYSEARKILGPEVESYLTDESGAKALSNALKIVINSVYGLTAASYPNPFKDNRNKDNIVAKRGALFMLDLKNFIEEQGYTVAHIKTDSVKIPNATQEIIDKVTQFGASYGYTFEHEHTYSKLCLVNDAVYIAKDAEDDSWTAVGTQFQVPYVFKTLFSKEPIEFDDKTMIKAVTTALYLNMNEDDPEKDELRFVGRIGNFCPIKPGSGGGLLLRKNGEKYDSASGAKGYRWMESERVKELKLEDRIDDSYFIKMVDDAIAAINQYGDFEQFAS